jgi:hypothetical protein
LLDESHTLGIREHLSFERVFREIGGRPSVSDDEAGGLRRFGPLMSAGSWGFGIEAFLRWGDFLREGAV